MYMQERSKFFDRIKREGKRLEALCKSTRRVIETENGLAEEYMQKDGTFSADYGGSAASSASLNLIVYQKRYAKMPSDAEEMG